MKTVFDAVSYADTQNLGYDVLAPGGTEVIDLPPEIKEEKKSGDKKVVVVFGNVNIPDNRKLGVGLYAKLTEWLATGTLRVRGVGAWSVFTVEMTRYLSRSPTEWKCCPMAWKGSSQG